jgi:hypothetical protein
MRNAYKILVSKPEGKRPLGRPRRRWEHYWILKKYGGEVCTGFMQFRLETSGGSLNMVLNLQVS